MNKKQRGFTLIELLVVVAIIGLLTSVIAVGFGNFRLKARDAKRLSDMKQIKTGLDLYYTTASGYPDQTVWTGGLIACNTTQFLMVPNDPATGVPYIYQTELPVSTVCGGTAYRNYYIAFTTEGNTDLGPPGTYYLTTKGFDTVAPF